MLAIEDTANGPDEVPARRILLLAQPRLAFGEAKPNHVEVLDFTVKPATGRVGNVPIVIFVHRAIPELRLTA